MATILMLLIFFTSLFLIVLILIQRGKGGGLAGAFGGAGGQSAFGTKAGDKFTRFTIYVAAFWILLCALAVRSLGRRSTSDQLDVGGPPAGAATGTQTPASSPLDSTAEPGTGQTPPPAATGAEQGSGGASGEPAAPGGAGGEQ